MTCPFCSAAAPGWRALHGHLAEAHAAAVVRSEDQEGRLSFHVCCPACPWRFEQALRGRRRDAAFLDEFAREITLVGLDQLIMHWVGEHATLEAAAWGGDSGDSERV